MKFTGREFTVDGDLDVIELFRYGSYEYYIWEDDSTLVLIYGSDTQLTPKQFEKMYLNGEFDDYDD